MLLGITNTSCVECCSSEDLLQVLHDDFREGKWKVKVSCRLNLTLQSDSRIQIARIDSGTPEGLVLIKQMGLNTNEMPALVAS